MVQRRHHQAIGGGEGEHIEQTNEGGGLLSTNPIGEHAHELKFAQFTERGDRRSQSSASCWGDPRRLDVAVDGWAGHETLLCEGLDRERFPLLRRARLSHALQRPRAAGCWE